MNGDINLTTKAEFSLEGLIRLMMDFRGKVNDTMRTSEERVIAENLATLAILSRMQRTREKTCLDCKFFRVYDVDDYRCCALPGGETQLFSPQSACGVFIKKTSEETE